MARHDAEDQPQDLTRILRRMYRDLKAQAGEDIRGFWLYDGDACPGCGFPIDAMIYQGRQALSLNMFIYRQRGILIGYLLCGRCARQIFDAVAANPGIQTTPLHPIIEQNLIKAYHRYLASLDA